MMCLYKWNLPSGSLFLGLFTILMPELVAKQIDVDCGKGDSLQKAVEKADPGDFIGFTGTCTEALGIPHDRLILDGGGSGEIVSAAFATVTVSGEAVQLRNLTLTNQGSRVLRVLHGSIIVRNSRIVSEGGFAGSLFLRQAHGQFIRTTFTGSATIALQAADASFVRLDLSSIAGTFNTGISSDSNASVSANNIDIASDGPLQNRGVIAEQGGTILLTGGQIRGYRFGATAASEGLVSLNNLALTGNERGLWLFGGSAAVFNSTVENNSEWGIGVNHSTIRLENTTVSNNTQGSMFLDTGSQCDIGSQSQLDQLALNTNSTCRISGGTALDGIFLSLNSSLAVFDPAVINTLNIGIRSAVELNANSGGQLQIDTLVCGQTDTSPQAIVFGDVQLNAVENCNVQYNVQ